MSTLTPDSLWAPSCHRKGVTEKPGPRHERLAPLLTTDELAVQARNQMVFSVNALVGDADNAVFF